MKKRFRKSYKKRIKKPLWKKRFFWIILGLILALSVIFYFAIFSDIFQIKNIEISGNQKIEEEIFMSFIENKIRKKILFFNTSSIFLFYSDNIQKETLKKFPHIKKIKIQKEIPETIRIFITERIPLGQWCSQNEEECFLIDEEGILFEKIEFSPGKMMIFKSKKEGAEGESVLTSREIIMSLKIWQKEGNDLRLWKFEFEDNVLKAEMVQGGKILFNLNSDIESQLLKLESVINEIISGEKIEKIDYIDLRFSDRVYFKEKD